MKRVKMWLIALMVISCANLFAEVSKEEARNIVYQIAGDEIEDVNIFQEEDILTDSDYVINEQKSINSPYSEYWLFFVDDIPAALWFHPCRYVLINSSDSEYIVINEDTAPQNYKSSLEEVSIGFTIEPFECTYRNPSPVDPVDPDPHKFAVLMVGVQITAREFYFWRTLSALYTTLKNNYGFTDENMIVLCQRNILYDDEAEPGSYAYYSYILDFDLDNDEVNDIDDGCYLSSIESAFDYMADNLGPDDQLFVTTIGHGGHAGSTEWFAIPHTGGFISIYDDDLAGFLAPINCGEMVITMGQCHSGGFIDELTDYTDVQCENRIIHTATDAENYAYTGSGIAYGFTEFAYYWVTGIRGFHSSYSEPWLEGYPIGTHPYQPLDFDPDDLDPFGNNSDGNEDDIFQLGESFYYAYSLDNHNPNGENYCMGDQEFPKDVSDIGFIDDVYSFYGYGGDITNSQTVSGVFNFAAPVKIGPEVTLVIDDGSLTICEDNSLTLFGRSVLEVTSGAEFYLDAGSSLYGTEHTVYEDPATGQRYDSWEEAYAVNPEIGAEDAIPGDRVTVNNGLLKMQGSSANPVTIAAVDDGSWDGIEISNSYSYDSGISYGNVSGISNLTLNNSHFVLNNTTYSNCGQIVAQDNSSLYLTYCIIENISCCPVYCYESRIHVLSSTIQNNGGKGLYIYLPSSILGAIVASTITSNDGWGVQIIDTPIRCIGNTIIDNSSHGFVSYGAGGTPILAGNRIANNGGIEIIGLYQWPDMTSLGGANTVHSHDNGGMDHYLLSTSVQGSDCRRNFINTSNHARFLPSYDYYIFDSEDSEEEILYAAAVEDISEEEYESAKTIMTEIVDGHPDTGTAVNALQWLLYLENFSGNDYTELRAYAESIDDVSHPNLERIKNKVITSTYMCEKDYLTSIDRLEDIIADPPSVEDSILALIHEGYCYLKLEEEGGKAAPVKCTFKPRSFNEFKYVSQNLTDNLLKPDTEPPETGTQTIEFMLHQNYPNPALHSTTFSFSIPANTQNAKLKIYNVKGQLVKTFHQDTFDKGTTNEITWNCKDDNGKTLCNGIYFYKLTADKKEIVKKMILMK